MDFKTAALKDMETFHNTAEFAVVKDIRYDGETYTVPVILDHETAMERKQLNGDNGEGINKIEVVAYIALADLGFVPTRGNTIDIDDGGRYRMFNINSAECEDGEIVLELGAYDE